MARLHRASIQNAVGKSKSISDKKQVVKQVAGLGEEVVTNRSIRKDW